MTEDQKRDMARTVEQGAHSLPSDMPDLRIGHQILRADGSSVSTKEAHKTPDRRMQETIWKLKTGLQQESQLLKLLSATQVKTREQAEALISDLDSILRNVLPQVKKDTQLVLGLLPEYRQQVSSSPDILPKNQRHLGNVIDKDIQAVLEDAPQKLAALIVALKITLTKRLNEFRATPKSEPRPVLNPLKQILSHVTSSQGLKSMGAIGLSGYAGLNGVDGMISPEVQPERVEVASDVNAESEIAVSDAIRSVSETLTQQLNPQALERLVENMGLSAFLDEIAESYQNELQSDPEAPVNPNVPNIPVVIQTLNGEVIATEFTVGQMAQQEANIPALVNRGVEILSRQLPPEIFADFTNLELVVTVTGNADEVESAANLPLQNGFVMLRLQEDFPVQTEAGIYPFKAGDMFVFNEPGGDLFFIPKAEFFRQLSATLANTIDISGFNAENTLFIPDPTSNVILVSDRATSTPFALLDLNALAASNGQYVPGVAIALEGIQNYSGLSRDANGQPIAIETAEAPGMPIPIQREGDYQFARLERPAAAAPNISGQGTQRLEVQAGPDQHITFVTDAPGLTFSNLDFEDLMAQAEVIGVPLTPGELQAPDDLIIQVLMLPEGFNERANETFLGQTDQAYLRIMPPQDEFVDGRMRKTGTVYITQEFLDSFATWESMTPGDGDRVLTAAILASLVNERAGGQPMEGLFDYFQRLVEEGRLAEFPDSVDATQQQN